MATVCPIRGHRARRELDPAIPEIDRFALCPLRTPRKRLLSSADAWPGTQHDEASRESDGRSPRLARPDGGGPTGPGRGRATVAAVRGGEHRGGPPGLARSAV